MRMVKLSPILYIIAVFVGIFITSSFSLGSDDGERGGMERVASCPGTARHEGVGKCSLLGMRPSARRGRSLIDIYSELGGNADTSLSVIVLEDCRIASMIARRFFNKKNGFSSVFFTESIEDALLHYDRYGADIVLLDHDLPNGTRGTQFLDEAQLTEGTIVYATSTQSSGENISKKNSDLISKGALYMLQKPWNLSRFKDARFHTNVETRRALVKRRSSSE